jgi:hypothetical protein
MAETRKAAFRFLYKKCFTNLDVSVATHVLQYLLEAVQTALTALQSAIYTLPSMTVKVLFGTLEYNSRKLDNSYEKRTQSD